MDISTQIELHSPEGIKSYLSELNSKEISNSKHLIYHLISEYTRSPRFKDCVKVFIEFGIRVDDKVLESVLIDDDASLKSMIKSDPEIVNRTFSLKSAYTPLSKVSLLHICAEFNHINCAKVLVENGVDINAKAGIDKNGFGGQTPIFHTVNQNLNQSKEMMTFLLSKLVDLQVTLKGIIWGKGYEWETLIPSVNPISYAMMGLLPQVHRDEKTISEIVSKTT